MKVLILTVLFVSLSAADEWSYKEEKSWPSKCLEGKHQSPVNLRKDTAERRVFNDVQLKNYDIKFPATIKNTGHSVAINIKDDGAIPTIKGGGLPHEYILDHLHFHWESEHTIHSNRYPLELHLVHHASIFNSTKTASQYDDGLAVLGVLFDIDDNDNPAFEPMLEKLEEVRDRPGLTVDLDSEVSPLAFLPKNIDNFFRYEGSLTTPGCNEAVVWTVFYHTSYISKKQLAYFPSIKTHEGILKSNYRSLQQLNDRVVVFRSNSYSSSASEMTDAL